MDQEYFIDPESPREEIIELQRNLMALGYELPRFGADGDYGGETINAVEAFQRDNGLEVTGIADATTLALIETKVQAIMALAASYEASMRQDILNSAIAELGAGEQGADNVGDRIAVFLRADEYTAQSNGDAAPIGSAWCAGFASHVLETAFPNLVDYSVLAKGLMRQFDAQGAFHEAGGEYTPQPGDLIFFERGQDGDWRGHVGFVEEVLEDGTIITIEGNVDHDGFEDEPGEVWDPDDPDSVRRLSYTPEELEENRILGFGNSFDMYVARNGMDNVIERYAQHSNEVSAPPVNTVQTFPQF